ncbi:MAG: DHH family phosphoesterase [Desulfovibrionaceae bacterium]|nr:DHH family phosphoesterase [Desulfovibrionaceae bacterium]
MAQSKNISHLKTWLQGIDRDSRWCILISADPDALASALALKTLMTRRAQSARIARVNDVTRPDNLAMIRHLRIPVEAWHPEMRQEFTHFAMVDSQPHHHPAFADLPFSAVIDHHPLNGDFPVVAEYVDIRPHMGATSTIMTRYLRALRKRPGRRLSTALLYGIRTDTAAFERSGGADDLQAYQWLSQHADTSVLRRIMRSEYLPEWLPLFSRAFQSLQECRGRGRHTYVGRVDSGDQLVAIADFFTRVHGLKWVAVSGVCGSTVIVIFRGDGSRHMGRLADACFFDVGSGGGHGALARAEFPLDAVGSESVRVFIHTRLQTRKLRAATA